MLANNETGVDPAGREAAASSMKRAGCCMSTRSRRRPIPCDINALGADLLTLSAHKIGGPKGVGALVRRDEASSFPSR